MTRDIETPEYKEAVGYLRDLYAAGVFHPDSATMARNTVARTNFVAGKFAIHREPINGFQDAMAPVAPVREAVPDAVIFRCSLRRMEARPSTSSPVVTGGRRQ